MPITIQVAAHPAKRWSSSPITDQFDLCRTSCYNETKNSVGIVQSSFPPSLFKDRHIISSTNGFVYSAFYAYNQHHHLRIRPDDVWFSILSQLNFYINANAEALRSKFVAHKGKKELEIIEIGILKDYDVGLFARKMTGLIQKNVTDADLRDWIMPAFSTTTDDDRTTASVLMMGAMQSYFSYGLIMVCGIPRVTLLGNREDWVELYDKLDKLDTLGTETVAWANVLRPIMKRFIMTFDAPESPEVKWFWERIAHQSGDSGSMWLSGWITAFCFWRKDGKCLYTEEAARALALRDQELENDVEWRGTRLTIDGARYYKVDSMEIPTGYASVPVKVDDNGIKFNTRMVAGSLGMQAVASGQVDRDERGEYLDTLQPLSGWFMCLDPVYEAPSPAWEAYIKQLMNIEEGN